jgi:hypothetical protein
LRRTALVGAVVLGDGVAVLAVQELAAGNQSVPGVGKAAAVLGTAGWERAREAATGVDVGLKITVGIE